MMLRTLTFSERKSRWNKIHVPRPPQSAMNKQRSISDLIRKQIVHLSHVEKSLPGERAGIDPGSIKTEGEAARYIEQVTAKLHAQGAPFATAVAPTRAKAKAPKAKQPKKAKDKRR